MANVLNAGLVTSEKFGVYTDMAREYLAVVGLTCGLSPHLGEIMVWPNIKTVDGQEKIMGIPARLKKLAEYVQHRSKAKNFSFSFIHDRVLAME